MTQFTFFVEAPPEWVPQAQRSKWLDNLFFGTAGDKEVTLAERLRQKGHNISLCIGVEPIDDEFVTLAHKLASMEIGLAYWIVLPDKSGYWTNASSLDQTRGRITETWALLKPTSPKPLRVGIDVEWPIVVAQSLMCGDIRTFIQQYFATLRGHPKNRKIQVKVFIKWMKNIGIIPEFYVMPSALEDITATGISLPKGARTVEMLYSSMMPKAIAPLAMRVLQNKNRIPALGIINGIVGETPGRMLGNSLPRHLTAKQLAEDMRIVGVPDVEEVYVFALNHSRALDIFDEALLMV